MNVSRTTGANRTSPVQPLLLPGHKHIVYSIAFLPDGKQFISGSMDNTVRTWSTKRDREIRTPIDCDSTVSAIAISNDGRWIATNGDRPWRVVLWSAATHNKVGECAGVHVGPLECLSFSADATMVVSGTGDMTVVVWRVPTGERLAGPFRDHEDAVVSVVFSPDGDQLATTDLRHVRILDSHSGSLILPPIALEVWALAWAAQPTDRVIFASCSHSIKGIDVETGAVSFEWTAHRLTITCISLSRDGQFIAASSNYDKTVRVWNTVTQQECVPALEHNALVRCAAISPDGSYVVAGGDDSTVYVWPIRDDIERIEGTSTSSTTIVTIDDDDDINNNNNTTEEGPYHNVDKRSPDDLTDQVTRDSQDPVASGGFADIYRGSFQENGVSIKVAIKAIKTYSGEDGDFAKKQKRLRREIKVWLNLRHVNVLPLLGTTIGFGRFPAMVCPWVENGALTSYLEDRYENLSVIEILRLLNDVASGLHYLHSRFVVHGDLSGSNVLIRGNGKAYIADFGLSMLLTELGGSTFATSFHARGTLRWTAPELLDLEVPEDGMEEESPRVAPTTQSDVYSFGGVMLQILSGKVPYHYYTREAQVVHAVSRGMTPRRPNCALVTERRWVLIRRCWSMVDITQSRPPGEEIVAFTEEELASASAA